MVQKYLKSMHGGRRVQKVTTTKENYGAGVLAVKMPRFDT